MQEPKLDIEHYVNELAQTIVTDPPFALDSNSASLESLLKGSAVELWSTPSGELFIVADEEDARRLGAPRGMVYTAAEMRRIVRINDPSVVREIHEWKHKFNGVVREMRK
jgi:hypothetical protein